MPTILLVEDHEINREMLTERLQLRGFTVICAVDGADGVLRARQQLPDVILMDMSLPVLDGWSATRQLKADTRTAHIPVIALTAHAMAGDREACLAAGCDAYTTKPIQFGALVEEIRRLVGA